LAFLYFHVIFAFRDGPLASLGIATSKLSFFFERTIRSHFDNDAAQMTASNPRAGWEKVGDQFYRKIQLYESVFDPDLELENYLVAGAPYGGAIGRWHDTMMTLS
jgi:hypothetical protein